MVNYELGYKIYLYLKVQRNACDNLGNSMSDQMGIFIVSFFNKLNLTLNTTINTCKHSSKLNSHKMKSCLKTKQNRIQKLSMHSNKISFFITLPPFVAPFNLWMKLTSEWIQFSLPFSGFSIEFWAFCLY